MSSNNGKFLCMLLTVGPLIWIEIKSLLAGVDESEADSLIHISNRLSEGLTTREQLKTQLPGKRATEESNSH